MKVWFSGEWKKAKPWISSYHRFLLWNISLAKIDVSYIFSISKKGYVAKSEFLKRCMFRFSRFYFVKEMYVTISGKMSKNFRKIQQKYEKAPLFC